ncbi:MAG: anti-phage protein KwaA [Peptoniphilaceae bacterium]
MNLTLFIVSVLVISIIFLLRRYKERKRIEKRNKMFENANKISDAKNVSKKINDGKTEKNNILLKTQMYIISLWLLFVLLIPITINVKGINADSLIETLKMLCKNNILSIVCLLMAVLGMVLFKQLEYRWKGTRNLSVKVEVVENQNYEYLTFLTTYLIPLVCINLDETRYVIVLFVLLIVIGIIFIKSDFYLGNPTLALMNYKLYNIQFVVNEQRHQRLVISKEKIVEGDFVESIPFDDKTWFVRRSKINNV